jgi:beta-lactam-binding protein with PASTA domain
MKNQTIASFAKDFYWTFPFLLFLAGYQSFNLFYKTHIIQAPHLVGKTLQKSMAILAQSKMNVRLITQKEDPDLPEGTILSQIPASGQTIKPHQTIFIVASKHPEKLKTPQLRGRFHDEIVGSLKEQKIRHKAFFIETSRPEGLCLAQIPQEGEPLGNDGLTLYFATDNNSYVLFPDLEGISVEDATDFLSGYGITPTIFHIHGTSEKHNCSNCKVKEQKPLSGSFVNLKKPFLVQLKV